MVAGFRNWNLLSTGSEFVEKMELISRVLSRQGAPASLQKLQKLSMRIKCKGCRWSHCANPAGGPKLYALSVILPHFFFKPQKWMQLSKWLETFVWSNALKMDLDLYEMLQALSFLLTLVIQFFFLKWDQVQIFLSFNLQIWLPADLFSNCCSCNVGVGITDSEESAIRPLPHTWAYDWLTSLWLIGERQYAICPFLRVWPILLSLDSWPRMAKESSGFEFTIFSWL